MQAFSLVFLSFSVRGDRLTNPIFLFMLQSNMVADTLLGQIIVF